MTVLTAIDVQAIQAYVFASDRLRDVVGGSQLIESILSQQALSDAAARYDGSVVFAGGGNALLRFDADADEESRARAFVAELSEQALRRDRSLSLAFAHRVVGPEPVEDHHGLMTDLARNRRRRANPVPDLGLGVTERCAFTGGVATDWMDTPEGRRPVASTITTRRDVSASCAAPEIALPALGDALGTPAVGYFPDEIDHLSAPEDGNELAIVHIDGNSMGASLAATLEGAATLDELLERLGAASLEIRTALAEAEHAAMQAVSDNIAGTEAGVVVRSPRTDAAIALRSEPGAGPGPLRVALPVRPILRAGDDLTFVCEGRLGITLAKIALQHLDGRVLEHVSGRCFHACAGVAITKRGAPFDRAYLLAEACCRQAKAFVRLHGHLNGGLSAIDWHVGSVGDDIAAHRSRHLTLRPAMLAREWRLTARPYPLHDDPGLGSLTHTLSFLDDEMLRELSGPNWTGRHRRLHRLGDAIRRSDDEAKALVRRWQLDAAPRWLRQAGFDPEAHPGHNLLLDALELVDRHLPMED